MPPVTAINNGEVRTTIGEDLDLAECCPQRVIVIRIAWKAAHADNKALIRRGGHADLAAELIP
jgi:hypothetical protein